MHENFKVMIWILLLVLSFIYFYSLVLTELIWERCPNAATPLVCTKFGDLLSSQMTLYQIIYSGLLWGELWEELREMVWYIQIVFLSYVGFALMVFLESVCTFFHFLYIVSFHLQRRILVAVVWVVLGHFTPNIALGHKFGAPTR